MATVDEHGKTFFFQPVPFTTWARLLRHVFFHLLADIIRTCFLKPALYIADYPFKFNIPLAKLAKIIFIAEINFLSARTIENLIKLVFGNIFNRKIHINSVMIANRSK